MVHLALILVLFSCLARAAPSLGTDIWKQVPLPEWVTRILNGLDISSMELGETVTAPNCEYPVRDFSIPESPRNMPAFSGKVSDPSYYVKDLIAILANNPFSKPVAQRFLPLFEGQVIEVLLVTQDALVNRSLAGAAAFCENQNGTKKIYMDKTAEIGTMIPVFMHELVHCVDEETDRDTKRMTELMQQGLDELSAILNKVAKENKKEKEATTLSLADLSKGQVEALKKMKKRVTQFNQFRSYRTERKAYNAEHILGKWMLTQYDSYYQGKGRVPASFMEPVPDDFIIKNYGIHPEWFERFRKGQCKTLKF